MSNQSLQPTAYEVRPLKDHRGIRSDFRCAAVRSRDTRAHDSSSTRISRLLRLFQILTRPGSPL